MHWKIGTEIELSKTVSPFDSIGALPAIDRTASNYLNAIEKVRKIKKFIETGIYDDSIVRYMLEDIDTKEQLAHSSYRDMGNLDFQILLTGNYYTNPNSMQLVFPMKIKKWSDKDNDIDGDLKSVNNLFVQLIKEISRTRYWNDKQLILTFSPYEIYQYCDSMLTHLPNDSFKILEKTMLYSKQAVYYFKTMIDRRTHNSTTLTNIIDLNINKG